MWGALTKLLSDEGEIKVHSPNASDFFGKTVGDVEIYYDDVLTSASECKQRPITTDDIIHGIKKALAKGVPEYFFVGSAGTAKGQKAQILAILKRGSSKLDLGVVDIFKVIEPLAMALNPTRRAVFGETVVELLREMRKFESANVGTAELRNSIKASNSKVRIDGFGSCTCP